MKKQQNRIQQTDIDRAKQVDIYKVLEEFNWTLDTTGTKILCPSLTHNDKHAGVPINRKNNTCRCFSCGKTFDTIKLVQLLSFRCRGIDVPFPKQVKDKNKCGICILKIIINLDKKLLTWIT